MAGKYYRIAAVRTERAYATVYVEADTPEEAKKRLLEIERAYWIFDGTNDFKSEVEVESVEEAEPGEEEGSETIEEEDK